MSDIESQSVIPGDSPFPPLFAACEPKRPSRVLRRVTELRDSIYYEQLAKAARKLASEHEDVAVRRRLRETAVRHERMARELARAEQGPEAKRSGFRMWSGRTKS